MRQLTMLFMPDLRSLDKRVNLFHLMCAAESALQQVPEQLLVTEPLPGIVELLHEDPVVGEQLQRCLAGVALAAGPIAAVPR